LLLACLLWGLPHRSQDLWTSFYGGPGTEWVYAVAECPSGAFVATGATQIAGTTDWNVWVFKTDDQGAPLWERVFGGPGWDKAYSVAVTPEEDIYVAGYTESFGAGGWDFWVIKLNSSGQVLWQKAYGGTAYDFAMGVVTTEDGGCAVVGISASFGQGIKDILLLRLTPDGAIQWQRTFGGENDDEANAICRTPDGGYCIAGFTQGFGAGGLDAWLLKVSNGGVLEWQKTYGGPTWDWLYSVRPLPGGGYAAVGATESMGSGGYDFFILRTDGLGLDLWEKVIGGPQWDSAGAVAVLDTDGSFAVAGHTQSYGGSGDWNGWVMKFSSVGELTGQHLLQGNKEDRGYGIIPVSTGGFLVGGGTYSYGPASQNGWLVRLDQEAFPGYTCVSTPATTATAKTATYHAQNSTALSGIPTVRVVSTTATSAPPFSTMQDCCVLTCVADAAPALGDAPLKVDFTATSTATYCAGEVFYYWEFGDSSQGSGPSVSHTYDFPGTYTWALSTVTGSVSCPRHGTITVDIPCTLACDAKVSAMVGQAPFTASFSSDLFPSACQGEPSYLWNFGDGSSSETAIPDHIYATPGVYAWSFTVQWDGATCADQGTLTVTEPCTLSCSASANPVSGETPLEVVFSSTVVPFHCNDPVIYLWNFGDGQTSSGTKPRHTYPLVGTYSWSLLVTSGNITCTTQGTVTVLPQCVITCQASVAMPAGPPSLAVNYSATATTQGCPLPVEFLWNFGDGATSVQAVGTHTYASPGSYTWKVDLASGKAACQGQGTVTVRLGVPGDCDGSESVSIGEVQKAVNMFLELIAPDCGVDCNGDGMVSIGDVQKVINGFLGMATSCQ
jgi:PKD repeat protein